MSKFRLPEGVKMCSIAASSECSDLQRELCARRVSKYQEVADSINNERNANATYFNTIRAELMERFDTSIRRSESEPDSPHEELRDRIADNVASMGNIFKQVDIVLCEGPKGRFIPKCTATIVSVDKTV